MKFRKTSRYEGSFFRLFLSHSLNFFPCSGFIKRMAKIMNGHSGIRGSRKPIIPRQIVKIANRIFNILIIKIISPFYINFIDDNSWYFNQFVENIKYILLIN